MAEEMKNFVEEYNELQKEVTDLTNQLGTLATKVHGFEKTVERVWESIEEINTELNSGNLGVTIDYTPILMRLVEVLDNSRGPPTAVYEEPRNSRPQDHEIDLDQIDWKIAGGAEARPSDPFAWAFIYKYGTQNVIPEIEQLFNLIQEYGELTIQGYEIGLGGDNKTLINRRKPKNDL